MTTAHPPRNPITIITGIQANMNIPPSPFLSYKFNIIYVAFHYDYTLLIKKRK